MGRSLVPMLLPVVITVLAVPPILVSAGLGARVTVTCLDSKGNPLPGAVEAYAFYPELRRLERLGTFDLGPGPSTIDLELGAPGRILLVVSTGVGGWTIRYLVSRDYAPELGVMVGGNLSAAVETPFDEYYVGERVAVSVGLVDSFGNEVLEVSRRGMSPEVLVSVEAPGRVEAMTATLDGDVEFYVEEPAPHNVTVVVDTGPISGLLRASRVIEVHPPRRPDFNSTHRPLVEMFTATWCGPCRRAEPAINHLYHMYRGSFTLVEFHVWDSGGGRLATPIGDSRADAYGVTGIPALVFDGREVVRGAADVRRNLGRYLSAIARAAARDVPEADLSVAHRVVGDRLEANVTVRAGSEGLAGARVELWVVEDRVLLGGRCYDNVFRGVILNTTVSLPPNGSVKLRGAWSPPGTNVDLENCRVVAVLSTSEGVVETAVSGP